MSDPVSKYLPEFEKMRVSDSQLNTHNATAIASGSASGENAAVSDDGYAKNPIRIKDLFTMCAGLDYDLNAPGIKAAIKEGRTSTRELVRAMSETVLGFEPGTRYQYSLCLCISRSKA
jgi:CubicO group peptidase (beta-lactamase class C family)